MNIIKRSRFSIHLKQIKLLIWDLDETLYFSPKLIEHVRNTYLNNFIGENPGRTKLEKEFIAHEKAGKKWYQILSRHKGISEKDTIINIETQIDKAKFIFENPELVKYFQGSNHKHTLVTNSPLVSAESILSKLGFANHQEVFNKILSIEDFNHPKPNSKILENIIKNESILPAQAMAIGDSTRHDILPAKQLGMVTSHIQRKQDLRRVIEKSEADYTFSTLSELIKLLPIT